MVALIASQDLIHIIHAIHGIKKFPKVKLELIHGIKKQLPKHKYLIHAIHGIKD